MSEAIERKATRYFVHRDEEGRVTYAGVDKGGGGTVVAENDQLLVVKWPAGKHWVGRGMQPAYHPASTDVLEKDKDGSATLLISWDNRGAQRRKPTR